MAETGRSVHFAAEEPTEPQDDEAAAAAAGVSKRNTTDDGEQDGGGGGAPSASSSLTRSEERAAAAAATRKREEKIGHRRVDSETGEVTYKRVPTSNLMSAIQLGVATILGSAGGQEPDRDLLLQDFSVVEKLSFPSEGSSHTPSHTYGEFRFIAYAPFAFRYFRTLFNIKPQDFLSSVCAELLVELSNPGASGSIFYLTNDDEFIIKTVQMKEAEFLQKLLPGYYMNLNQNARTLLPKFFGLFCYQNISKNIRLLAMNNLLPTSIRMHQKYDLKGSTYKRKASKRERAKDSPTLKDLDFLEDHPDGLSLESATYDALMRTISRDCLVLESFKIMDYSMLIGIHNLDQAEREANDEQQASTSGLQQQQQLHVHPTTAAARARKNNRQKSLLNAMESIQATAEPIDLGDDYPYGIPARNAKNERLLLFVGIIDILQFYRFLKKFEHAWKSVLHDGDTISVHRPPFYSQRFQDFMKKSVFRKTQSPLKHSPSRRRSRKSVSASGGDQEDGAVTPSNIPSKRKSLTRQDNIPDFFILPYTEGVEAAASNSNATPATAATGAALPLADRPAASSSRRAPDRLFAPTPPPQSPAKDQEEDAGPQSPTTDTEEVTRL